MHRMWSVMSSNKCTCMHYSMNNVNRLIKKKITISITIALQDSYVVELATE